MIILAKIILWFIYWIEAWLDMISAFVKVITFNIFKPRFGTDFRSAVFKIEIYWISKTVYNRICE